MLLVGLRINLVILLLVCRRLLLGFLEGGLGFCPRFLFYILLVDYLPRILGPILGQCGRPPIPVLCNASFLEASWLTILVIFAALFSLIIVITARFADGF